MIAKFKEYSFITETLQKGESILKNKLSDYEKIKNFLNTNNSMGYMGKFTEFLFNGVPYNELVNLYNQIIDFKRKNIKINVDSYDKYESILDDIDKKKIAYKFKSIYNKFPREQKELFNLDEISNEDILTISKLYDIEDITPFINKISIYKNKYDLLKAVERYLSGKIQSFSREDVKKLLDDDLELVFENDNILIVKVKNLEAIKKIGSDTSWCIVRSEHTFDKYNKNKKRNQFVVFDYTKDPFEVDFKIGFTVDNNNYITNAHDILDHDAILQVRKLIEKNNVELSNINVVQKVDFSLFNKTSMLKDIENALESRSILEDDEFSKMLSILCWKLSRSRNGYIRNIDGSKKLIRLMFKNLRNKKNVEVLTENDIEPYKNCFVNEKQFDLIKELLINEFILLSNEPPSSIFSRDNIDFVTKYYKNWDYKLDNDIIYYMSVIEENSRYADVLLFYASKEKQTKPIKILIEYCKMIKGEKIDLESVKMIIDKYLKEIEENYDKLDFYNEFGIKYHFDEKKYYHTEVENIIPEKVILKEPQYSLVAKLNKLVNCEVELMYTKDAFLYDINDYYKILNNNIVRKAHKVDVVVGQMAQFIKDKLTSKSRKIAFKDDVKFPIEFEIELSSSELDLRRRIKLLPKMVKVIIK